MRTISVTVGPLAGASATAIMTASTPSGAGALTLNGALVSGGVATLDFPRRVLFTTASNESAKTITIVGTDWNGNKITETVTGPNATTGYTVFDYATVTSVSVSAAFTGNLSIGTNGIASSRPIFTDQLGRPEFGLQVEVTGTVNYSVQQSESPIYNDAPTVASEASRNLYTSMVWVDHPDSNLVGATAGKQGNYAYPPRYIRLLLNSGTGTVILRVTQAGGSSAA